MMIIIINDDDNNNNNNSNNCNNDNNYNSINIIIIGCFEIAKSIFCVYQTNKLWLFNNLFNISVGNTSVGTEESLNP